FDRAAWSAIAAEVREVVLVENGGVPKRELAFLERRDDERWRVLRGARELLLDAVQVLHRAAVVVFVVRADEAFREAGELRRIEREGHKGVLAREGVFVGHGRAPTSTLSSGRRTG